MLIEYKVRGRVPPVHHPQDRIFRTTYLRIHISTESSGEKFGHNMISYDYGMQVYVGISWSQCVISFLVPSVIDGQIGKRMPIALRGACKTPTGKVDAEHSQTYEMTAVRKKTKRQRREM